MLRHVLIGLLLMSVLVTAPAWGGEDTKPAQERVTRCDPHCYSTAYLFPVTREMQNACLHPLATAALAPLTIVVDVVLLPAGVVMGLFG